MNVIKGDYSTIEVSTNCNKRKQNQRLFLIENIDSRKVALNQCFNTKPPASVYHGRVRQAIIRIIHTT